MDKFRLVLLDLVRTWSGLMGWTQQASKVVGSGPKIYVIIGAARIYRYAA